MEEIRVTGWRGAKGENCGNSNSIINKIDLIKNKLSLKQLGSLVANSRDSTSKVFLFDFKF